MTKTIFKSNVVNFYELSEEWQAEAIRNLDDEAQEAMYIEPSADKNPKEHVLYDLNEAMRAIGEHEGFSYNATITISNNSAMLLKFNDDMSEVEYIYA